MRRTERTVQEGNIESAIQRVTEVHGHPTARFLSVALVFTALASCFSLVPHTPAI